jgi:hypothetical protein
MYNNKQVLVTIEYWMLREEIKDISSQINLNLKNKNLMETYVFDQLKFKFKVQQIRGLFVVPLKSSEASLYNIEVRLKQWD